MKGVLMSKADEARHKAEEIKGDMKEKLGDATDNERMQAEGAAEERSAKVKQVGDDLKDAAHDVRDDLR